MKVLISHNKYGFKTIYLNLKNLGKVDIDNFIIDKNYLSFYSDFSDLGFGLEIKIKKNKLKIMILKGIDIIFLYEKNIVAIFDQNYKKEIDFILEIGAKEALLNFEKFLNHKLEYKFKNNFKGMFSMGY